VNIRNIFLTLAGVLLLFSCVKRGESRGDPENPQVKLSRIGVRLDLPRNFTPIEEDALGGIAGNSLSTLQVAPFSVSPLSGFAEKDGKATLIISTLEFTETGARETNPMANIYTYQRNLEDFFGAGEISFEEIEGKELSLLIMAMSFGEGEDETVLFKGLCYKYPEHFFVLDLYVRQPEVSPEDAQGYRNMFLSLDVY
jgi:hypothetical protein